MTREVFQCTLVLVYSYLLNKNMQKYQCTIMKILSKLTNLISWSYVVRKQKKIPPSLFILISPSIIMIYISIRRLYMTQERKTQKEIH